MVCRGKRVRYIFLNEIFRNKSEDRRNRFRAERFEVKHLNIDNTVQRRRNTIGRSSVWARFYEAPDNGLLNKARQKFELK